MTKFPVFPVPWPTCMSDQAVAVISDTSSVKYSDEPLIGLCTCTYLGTGHTDLRSSVDMYTTV